MPARLLAVLALLSALAGFGFASMSTRDFAAHLDRQVHSIHCSFTPGLTAASAGGSDCQVTMMSPYSSVLRSSLWGGIPVSLPAMGMFALLALMVVGTLVMEKERHRETTFLLAAFGAIPVLASIVMGYLAAVELDAACKLCIGIYLSSAAFFVLTVLMWREAAGRMPEPGVPQPSGLLMWTGALALSGLFVLLPTAAYAYNAPDYSAYDRGCGELASPSDDYGVLMPIGASEPGAQSAIEVLDPLCPACRAFEGRLQASGLAERLERKAVLFPLDAECNWMVDDSMHPGACVVSEAMLCADQKAGGTTAQDVLTWAFDEQERIREAASKNKRGAAQLVSAQFPALSKCIGSPGARARLNKSLRWAVKNRIQVLTPQLFVGGRKVCDEDTDLGLEYTLTRRLEAPAPAVAP